MRVCVFVGLSDLCVSVWLAFLPVVFVWCPCWYACLLVRWVSFDMRVFWVCAFAEFVALWVCVSVDIRVPVGAHSVQRAVNREGLTDICSGFEPNLEPHL